jgi:CheY-like chemotaxis protein
MEPGLFGGVLTKAAGAKWFLPDERSGAAMSGSGISSSLLKGRHVLVIEDEYFLAHDMAQLLRGWGAEVIGPLGEVDDALQLVKDGGAVDLALLDINLRGEMIYPVADELRRRAIPFIFISGYERRPLPAGYEDVPLLQMPVDDEAVRQALYQLIPLRRQPAAEK